MDHFFLLGNASRPVWDTQEVDNMNIRATEDLIEDLMAPLEREVLEAPAVVKTSGNTSLQHGL